MSATEFLGGRFRSYLNDGSPNINGKLWTFADGTTTFQTTYVEPTLTTPNAYESNGFGGLFIRLDARGEALVYLGPSPYTFREETPSGDLIDTTSGIQSVAGQIAAALAIFAAGLPPVVNLPAGSIVGYGGAGIPAGFLPCNGSEFSRTSYAALFAAIGTTFGIGNGSTTANLPDSRRRVEVGAGGTGTAVLGNTIGNTGGAETHALTVAELAAHAHTATVSDPGHAHTYLGPIGGSLPPQCNANTNTASIAATSSATTGVTVAIADAGSSSPVTLFQPSLVVTKLIKT